MIEFLAYIDLVTARGDIPVTMGLGRHTNDHTTSFYLRTPSGRPEPVRAAGPW